MPPLLKFLIVDDVPENRFLVSKTLLKKFPGSMIQECEESTPAIASAQHDRLSTIIVHRCLDVDGPTAVALLRRVNPSVPIVMVSGRESCPAAIEAGANAFLNYEAWQRIGLVVEETMAAEKARAHASKFPFISVPKPTEIAPAPAAEDASDSVPKRQILYVEDNEADVELLRKALAAEGVAAEVKQVSDPLEFFAALKKPCPDLILADGDVAGFSTAVVLETARASWPEVPFYSLSGHLTPAKITALLAKGITGCLSKGDLPNVRATIRRSLGGE